MSNSRLYNKTFKVPDNVLNYIKRGLVSYPDGNGVKRAKNILKNGLLTYQSLKRLKNFFDYYNDEDRAQYILAGGDLMKSFVESKLNSERDGVDRSDNNRRDIDLDVNLGTRAYGKPRLNESNLKKNAIAIIVNVDNKFLLLKRSSEPNQWMPNKWALVGGEVDKGESVKSACIREIKEETNIDVDKLIKLFVIQRNLDSVEHVFTCRYGGDSTEIVLDKNENVSYGWFDINEIKFLDIVPNLIEYLTLAFIKYE